MPRARHSAVELDSGRRKRAVPPRACEHPGCAGTGEFRAPRGRDRLDEYLWFCLDHVRAYNAAWDYYRGMNEAEIEDERRRDTVGRRPTWPMGPRMRFHGHARIDPDELRAAFRRLFGEEEFPEEMLRARPPTPEEEALKVLDLAPGASMAEVKARYKALAKRHHPDANGGDKAAEDRLKSINQAYSFLKTQANPAKHAAGD
jgi:hypothetical protein